MDQTADRAMLNKVPLITAAFWIIKILATTVGETGADYLNFNVGLGLALTAVVMAVALVGLLVIQFRQSRYVPWIYWLVVVFVSVVGTLITDLMTDSFGISLYLSTAVFTVLLGLTFLAWHNREHTLSIHAIDTRSREAFYWAAILFTFALGTAAGDLLSEQMGLGYAKSGLIFGGGIALVTLGYYLKLLGPVLAFWIAYILTRPLGASIGDFLTQLPKAGGLGLAPMMVTAVFLVLIVALVVYLTISGSDRVPPEERRSPV
ncbi:MAG: hypothetical protein ABIT16_09650 [Croceibacterium sp.]